MQVANKMVRLKIKWKTERDNGMNTDLYWKMLSKNKNIQKEKAQSLMRRLLGAWQQLQHYGNHKIQISKNNSI